MFETLVVFFNYVINISSEATSLLMLHLLKILEKNIFHKYIYILPPVESFIESIVRNLKFSFISEITMFARIIISNKEVAEEDKLRRKLN